MEFLLFVSVQVELGVRARRENLGVGRRALGRWRGMSGLMATWRLFWTPERGFTTNVAMISTKKDSRPPNTLWKPLQGLMKTPCTEHGSRCFDDPLRLLWVITFAFGLLL